MIYESIYLKSELCSCENEGDLLVEINNMLLKTYFQVSKDFYDDFLSYKDFQENKVMKIDLWLVYGVPKLINQKDKIFPNNNNGEIICGGLLKGQVISFLNDSDFRLDCGINIDVHSEKQISNIIKQGDFIEISGTYQVYFPDTEYSWDAVGY